MLWVAAVSAAKTAQAAEDPLDGGRVITQHVGGPRHMVAVAGGHRKRREGEVKGIDCQNYDFFWWREPPGGGSERQ